MPRRCNEDPGAVPARPAALHVGRPQDARRDGGQGLARLFWALTAGLALWALVLAGSQGAMVGLAAGAGSAALFYAVAAPSAGLRRGGRIATGGLALAAVALAVAMVLRPATEPARDAAPMFGAALLERATSTERIGSTLGRRLDNWEAGLRAFTDRPALGWGPHNYLVAVSRYDRAATNRARDHAHNMAVEEAVTKGVPGLLAWLALWGLTFVAALRAEQALPLFVGAALLGWLVQSLSAFYTATASMQHVVLLGFLARAEIAMRAGAPPPGGALRGALQVLARGPARAALAVLAVALCLGSLGASHAIHGGAAALYRAETAGPFMRELRRSIRAFEPLATNPRIILFENVAPNWRVIVDHDPARAERLAGHSTRVGGAQHMVAHGVGMAPSCTPGAARLGRRSTPTASGRWRGEAGRRSSAGCNIATRRKTVQSVEDNRLI